MVRIDKALGTSKAVFCFFTLWMQATGITNCKSTQSQTEKVRKSQCGEFPINLVYLLYIISKNMGRGGSQGRAGANLSVLQQNWGVETGMGISDVQPTMVWHFFLQGTDVCWERRREEHNTLSVLCGSFIKSLIFSFVSVNLPCIKSSLSGMSGNNLWNVLLCFMKL